MIAPSRIASKCSRRKTLMLPVAVMNRSPQAAASPAVMTANPSMSASSARTGSTSTTATWAPWPAIREVMPLPTQPYPATTTLRPAMRMLVARRMPSSVLCPVP